MSNPPPGGRKPLAATSRPIDPMLAAAAPHDPMLAIQCGHLLVDDVEAMVESLPTRAAIDRLPPRQRVVEAQAVCDALDRCRWQIDDARTIVYCAIAEAAP